MGYRVSVITPVYNAEKTLERAFNSIKIQTIGFENIEYLLIDDCSTDGSYDTICRMAKEYPNVKALKTNKNSGAPGAPRNIGLENATAPYIMFLDNDDEYVETACEALVKAVESYSCDSIKARHYMLCGDKKKIEDRAFNLTKGKQYIFDEDWWLLFWGYCPLVWDKIFRRDIIDKYSLRFPEGSLGEDDVFSFMYAVASKTVVMTDDIVYCRHMSETSLSEGLRKKSCRKLAPSFIWMFKRAGEIGLKARFDKAMDKAGYIVCILDYILEDERGSSREEIDKLLKDWAPVFSYAYDNGFNLYSAESKIIFRDLYQKQYQNAVDDFFMLQELKEQRKKELDDIFNSTTWKIASAVQKLKFWSK